MGHASEVDEPGVGDLGFFEVESAHHGQAFEPAIPWSVIWLSPNSSMSS